MNASGWPGPNLPAQLTSFIGRDRELAELKALLGQSPSPGAGSADPRGSGTRLLTLTGPAGIGKTRLALQLGSELQDECQVGFVQLTPIHEPALVLPTIGRALGVLEQSGGSLERLQAALGDRASLLVLDNFEHLLDAAGDIACLLEACRGLALVVTSRAALRLYGEQQYPVPPLARSLLRLKDWASC